MQNNIQIAKSDFDLIIAILQRLDIDGEPYETRKELEGLLDRMERKNYSLLSREAYSKMLQAKAVGDTERETNQKIEYLKYKGLSM